MLSVGHRFYILPLLMQAGTIFAIFVTIKKNLPQ